MHIKSYIYINVIHYFLNPSRCLLFQSFLETMGQFNLLPAGKHGTIHQHLGELDGIGIYILCIYTPAVYMYIYIYYIIQHYIQTNYKKCQRTMDGVITRLASSFGCASRRMMYVMVSFISGGVRYFVYTAILLYI